MGLTIGSKLERCSYPITDVLSEHVRQNASGGMLHLIASIHMVMMITRHLGTLFVLSERRHSGM